MSSRGYKDLPSTAKGIAILVNQFAEKVKTELKLEISQKKCQGLRFSFTVDEWTNSVRNRRFCCFNLHLPDGDFIRIGLKRIRGSMKAEGCLKLTEEILDFYDLMVKDSPASCTDGASLMEKYGRLLKIIHQMCHQHGIHLAVTDVLYKARDSDVFNDGLFDDCEEEREDDEEIEGDDEEGTLEISTEAGKNDVPEYNFKYKTIILGVRKIMVLFRRSPVKNDDLQMTITHAGGKEKALPIDTP